MKERTSLRSLRAALGLILVCSLVLGNSGQVSAAPLRCYVDVDAAGGGNNGGSWADAYINLYSALGTSPCTEVWVAAGVYKPTAGTDRTVSFQLKSGVVIYGGFAGGETQFSQRDPAANLTTLSGDIGGAGTADNSYHVVSGSGTDSSAVLDGFTITAGRADGETLMQYRGGGVYNAAGSPSLADVTISGNWAGYGGGMHNESSSPSLTNVTISGNGAGYGGGMHNQYSNPSLADVTISGNTATFDGGGMHNQNSNPTLAGVTISGNTAARHGGGMYGTTQSSPGLANVTISGNTANSSGGGMYNASESSPSLTNVTISGNTAGLSGGGIYNAFTSSPVIGNSILYGDTGGEIYNYDPAASHPTVSFSIIQGGFAGTGNLDADPRLKPLGNYGGVTQTMPLGVGSPAIDTGTNTGCPATDQRGIARPQDGDGNGTVLCDMGATESRRLAETFRSAGAQDGWVLESNETSDMGGTMNASATTLLVGDDALDRQYKGILSFNTAPLPDIAEITSVTLKIRSAGVMGTNPFLTHGSLVVDVRKGGFGGSAALQVPDFQAAASKNVVMRILNNPVNGWYSKGLAAANFTYINKTGATQLRLRFAQDDNDDLGMDVLKFYSGNHATASLRPQLIVKYYVP